MNRIRWRMGLLLAAFSLAGCGADNAVEKVICLAEPPIEAEVEGITVTRYSGGEERVYRMEGDDLLELKEWAAMLALVDQFAFEDGEQPGAEEEGGVVYEFVPDGAFPSFSYRDFGDAYLVMGDWWYLLEHSAEPPLPSAETEESGGDLPAEPDHGTEGDAGTIGLTLLAEDVTPTGLTFVCRQSGGTVTGELDTGADYWLEVLEDGQWKDWSEATGYVVDVIYDDVALIINQEGESKWEFDWSNSYGTLPEGQYRIGKEFMDYRGPGDYDVYVGYAEFAID